MGNVNINYTNGSLGGILPSADYVSAFMFDSTQLPSGFTATDRIKTIYSLQDAVNLGITNTSDDETKATGGNLDITAIGAVGDYIKVYVTPANHAQVLLGSYTVKTGDVATDVVAGLISNINLNTSSTQWTAVGASGDTIDLIAPNGLGASINGAGVITTASKTGTTFAVNITDFSDGVGSQIDLMHYTLSTFFKANQTAKVYVSIYDFTSAFDATKIATVQTYASGEIRQMGILLKKGLESVVTIVGDAQASCADQGSKHKPLSVVIGLQPGAITELGDLINTRGLASSNITVTISNEYGTDKKGYNLVGTTGYYPTDLGAVLGHVSRSKVSHSIAWVEKNLTQFADVMFVTGETWNDVEDGVIPDEVFNKGYLFERKYISYSGCYFDNDVVCDSFTSDYISIKRRRTIDKAARISYSTLIPYLSSPVVLNPNDGTLSEASILVFKSALNSQLDSMQNNLEISGYSVFIDPTQNILASKNLVITITIVPIGSADEITVNLGYALSIS